MEFLIIFGVLLVFWLAFKENSTIEQPIVPKTLEGTDTYKKEQFLLFKAAYFKTVAWSKKRLKVLARDNHRCTSCGSYTNLTVHHDSGYDLIPNEPVSCLRTLCRRCHTAFHKTYGFPQTYNDYMTWNTVGVPFTHPLLKVTHEQDQKEPSYTSSFQKRD